MWAEGPAEIDLFSDRFGLPIVPGTRSRRFPSAKTWGRLRRTSIRGHTPPELIVPGSRFSVNMISTITNQGTVRWMIYPGTMNAASFLVFLTRLIAGATKKVFLIVDHLSVHEAAVV